MKRKKKANTPTASAQKHFKVSKSILIRQCVMHEPKTRRQIEDETGIHYNTVDWEVDTLFKNNNVFVAYKGKCPVSKRNGVQFITANEAYRLKLDAIQPSLFDMIGGLSNE
ncbi:MAG: hypothetical protein PF517_21405 [Salinivirgaceae bacterium]|jgi:hypothetical protein|nr:hypothetical protein [Salinivirgaceae bacterium]